MTDKNKKEQIVPYKFYCANGEVFCARLGFPYYKVPGFERMAKQNGEIWLNKDKNEFELVKGEAKLTPTEEEIFKKLLCDKQTYQKMWHIAEKLSEKFPSMRVDLFCVKQPEKDKNGKDVYKIYFNELQRNSQGTYQLFVDDLEPEALEKYNEMMHFRNVPDDKLTTAGKIIKNIDIKQHNKKMQVEKIKKNNQIIKNNDFAIINKKKEITKKRNEQKKDLKVDGIKQEQISQHNNTNERKPNLNIKFKFKNKNANNKQKPLGTDINKKKKVIDKN